MRRNILLRCLVGVFAATATFPSARGADYARIQQSIGRGAAYLRSKIDSNSGGRKAIIALALLKAGQPADSPEIQHAIANIRKQMNGNEYVPESEHIYAASVSAVLLADASPEENKPVLDAIAAYIVKSQRPDGAWDYPPPGRNTEGDTSVTHYALLGLWACARAGSEVPADVWEKAIRWHMSRQNADGGFSYTPGFMNGDGAGASMPNMSINAVGSMAIAWMNLSPGILPSLEADEPKPDRPMPVSGAPRNNDALEAVVIDESEFVPASAAPAHIPEGTSKSMRRAFGWFAARFSIENTTTSNQAYYYYSLERMTALVSAQQVGGHDWYTECSEFLMANQQEDGSWRTPSTYGPDIDTAFVVLSLLKSTAKLIKPHETEATFGKGILIGGRGLPDDLQNGTNKSDEKRKKTPLDDLLNSLSKATNLDAVEEVQQQLVEQVQIGDRDALIQQKDLLVRLIQHPNAEVRRTAAWALGRTNDLRLSRYLVSALDDPDVGVDVEAHNALCWISRKPLGFDLSLDPFEGLPLDAGPDVKAAAIGAWRAHATKLWGEWYLRNRPYEDRGDEFEAQLREKIATTN